MSGTLNKVMLIGHLGDEVKMHYFDGGGCIGRFPVATDESYTNRTTGERINNTEWHNVVVRNKGAEICEKYLKKGDKVYIEGRIRTRKWQDENGNDRYSTEIQSTDFTFLTPKADSGNMGAKQNNTGTTAKPADKNTGQQNQNQSQSQPNQTEEPIGEEEDDLPF